MRLLLGVLLGNLARLWLKTLRLRVESAPELQQFAANPWVLSFWHGTQFPLLAWRRRTRTHVLVSHSRDGALQTGVLRTLGLHVVRGSSSRGGAKGLLSLVRNAKLSAGDAAFAVDGPRGPHGVAKEGAVLCASALGGILVPMGSSVRSGLVLRSWDRFAVPWPFSVVSVVLGEPIEPSHPEALVALQDAVHRANARASELAQ